MARKKAQTHCKWCDAGHKVDNGLHWIVQSIIPAKMKVMKCRRAAGEKLKSDAESRP